MFKKKRYDFDLIIIGSGAGGSVGAHYAASLGKKVAIFEKEAIGGECPNFACVPTKSLLFAADVYQSARNASAYGINTKDVDFDYLKVKKWKDLVVSRTGTDHGEQTFSSDHITLIKAKASFISNHEVEADGKKYSASKILIATGSNVFLPPIPGLLDSGFITFKEAVDFTTLPKSIFILGGGPIGCEFAEIFSTFGSKVILADNLERLIFREDKEVSDLIQAIFENKGIKVLTKINVDKIEKKGNKKIIHYTKDQKHHEVEVDELMISTGKRPSLDFNIEKTDLKIDKGHLKISPFLQTNVPNIFAAGDVAGPYLFTHTGYYQSYLAVQNMFSTHKIKQDFRVVPRCVFTKPEVASVGITEVEAQEKGLKIKKGLAAIAMLGRANTSNEFDGFIKVITDHKKVIIGASIVAPRAGEMIHELALAISLRAKSTVLADMMHAYPTYSEGIKIACSLVE